MIDDVEPTPDPQQSAVTVIERSALGDNEGAFEEYRRIVAHSRQAVTLCTMVWAVIAGEAIAAVRTRHDGCEGVIGVRFAEGTNPGPVDLAVGRVVACAANDDLDTVHAVLDALTDVDMVKAGWAVVQEARRILVGTAAARAGFPSPPPTDVV